MNIPENILQQVADAAFKALNIIYLASDPINGEYQADYRRAVIQHAISNPAFAPFLAGGIGEYTDMEIADAWRSANLTMPFVSEIKRFLSALPRRESPALAEASARAEKAEKELAAIKSSLPAAEATLSAEPETDAQVPLGPEDCPPGSVFTFGAKALWITPLCVASDGVGFPETEPNNPLIQKFSFELLQEAAKINTSISDTGRWDANAWRPCSKPGKEVAK
jgi:hypothetical protein